jgi:ABC-2 type transport system permease protein
MRTFDLMLKDLRQVLRDRRSLIFLLVMPVIFTVFMGFALRPAAPGDPRLPVGLVVEDEGLLGQKIEPLMEASSAIRPVRVEAAAEAEAQVQKGELAAALVLPAGFTTQLMAGSQPELSLIADTLKPEGQTARQAVQGIVMRLLSAAQAGTYSVQAVKPTEAERGAVWEAGVEQAVSQWLASTLSIQVEQATVEDPSAKRPVAYAQSSPGMLVMFSMFGLMNAATVLVLERRTRTLQRMLTTSMRRAEIIAGHLLAMFTLVFVQGLLLIIFGQLAFGVDYLRAPAAVLTVLAALALWVASLGLLISALAKGEEQVVMFAMIGMFVFSALGGAWFPLEGTGGAFAAIGKLMPTAWAMTGFQNIVVRGLDFNSILLPAVILFAYAAAFFGLAVWRFKFE